MIKITMHGIEDIQSCLNQLYLKVGSSGMEPVFHDIGEHLVATTKQRFKDSVDPDGNAWQRNSAHTMAALLNGKNSRKKDGTLRKKTIDSFLNKKPLIDTGKLSSYIRYQADNESVAISSYRMLGKGSNKVNAAVHQFGSKDGKTPARPFLGISKEDSDYILKDIIRYLGSSCQ